MIFYEWMLLFVLGKKRWMAVGGLLFSLSVLAGFLIGPQWEHVMTPLDFMVAAMNQKLICLVWVPVCYLFLISDVAVRDLSGGTLSLLITRIRSRSTWFFAKACSLFITAFIVTVFTGLVLCLGGLLWGLSPSSASGYPLILHVPGIVLYPGLFSLYVLGLTTLGMVVLVLSLWWKKSVWAWIAGTVLSLVAFGTYIFNPEVAVWLPSTHMKFDLHAPFNPNNSYRMMTLGWSFVYLTVVTVFNYLLGLFRFRKMNLLIRETG